LKNISKFFRTLSKFNKDFNAISILMVKRGIAQDLARLSHSLDLSSPDLAPTINASLKALEILSKVAGYSIMQPKDKKKDEKKSSLEDPSQDQSEIESQEPNMDLDDGEDDEFPQSNVFGDDSNDEETDISPTLNESHNNPIIMIEPNEDGEDDLNRSEEDEDHDDDDEEDDDEVIL
jgi:E3 ubiquitin-protein ligase HUWE1